LNEKKKTRKENHLVLEIIINTICYNILKHQNLYYSSLHLDQDDGISPHIMLFTVAEFFRIQKHTYKYHYKIDEVINSSGNVNKNKFNCNASKYCNSL